MNEYSIRKSIRKGLNLLSESEVFSLLSDRLNDVEEHIIDVSEKKLKSLQKQEEQARDKEEYIELKTVKNAQLKAIQRLIKGYLKKIDILKNMEAEHKSEAGDIGERGNRVFVGKEIKSFTADQLKKGNTLQIETISSIIKLQKIADYNAFKVLSTNMQGVHEGDLLKIGDMTTGSGGDIEIYRSNNQGRFEKIGNSKFGTVLKIIKNPE